MARESLTAPVTSVVAGAELLKASAASTWNAFSSARISLTGGRSTRYRLVSWAFSASARDELTTPRTPPASVTRINTTPKRTMARCGEYQRQRSRSLGFDPLLTAIHIGTFAPLHKL